MIDHNRRALMRVLAGLFVMAGIEPGTDSVATLPRSVKSAILLLLRPAESAFRRLVFAKARSLDLPAYVASSERARSKGTSGKKGSVRAPQFRLIDPRKFFAELYPNRKPRRARPSQKGGNEPHFLFRFSSFDGSPACEAWSEKAPEASPDDPMIAAHICRRMQALHHALNDIPKQVNRMLRVMSKRATAPPGPKSVPPIRVGFPPGYRKKEIHEVDRILKDCHWLATHEPVPPD